MNQAVWVRKAVICAVAGFAAPAAAESSVYQAITQLHGAPESGVELGYGWDDIREKPINARCVEFAPVLATGQHATVHMHEVSDQSEIMDRLGVSASAAVNSTFGSVSGQASFAKSANVSSKSTTLLLKATVQNSALFTGPVSAGCAARKALPVADTDGTQTGAPDCTTKLEAGTDDAAKRIDDVHLTEAARELIKANDDEAFIRQCGDGYVSAIYSGAELLGTISFENTSKAEDTKKEASVKASVKAAFGSGQAGVEAEAESKTSAATADLDIHFAQIGGGNGPVPVSRAGLVDKLKSLAQEAAADPKFVMVEVTSYTALADEDQRVPTRKRSDRELPADYYWFLTSFENDISDVLSNSEKYDLVGRSPASLRDLQDISFKIRERIRTLERPVTISSVIDLTKGHVIDFTKACNAHQIGRLDPEPLPTLSDLRTITDVNDLAELKEKLRTVVPYCNPNVLRLYLPVPFASTARDPVEVYVRKLAHRMCQLDPSDNECMTNAQIDALARGLGSGMPWKFRLQNADSGTCISVDEKKDHPIPTGDCGLPEATQFALDWNSSKWERTEPEPGLGEYALVFNPTADARSCVFRERDDIRIKIATEDNEEKPWFTQDRCAWKFLADGRIKIAQKTEWKKEDLKTKPCMGIDDSGDVVASDCERFQEEQHRIRWNMIPVEADR